jgi:hypothetical protein
MPFSVRTHSEPAHERRGGLPMAGALDGHCQRHDSVYADAAAGSVDPPAAAGVPLHGVGGVLCQLGVIGKVRGIRHFRSGTPCISYECRTRRFVAPSTVGRRRRTERPDRCAVRRRRGRQRAVQGASSGASGGPPYSRTILSPRPSPAPSSLGKWCEQSYVRVGRNLPKMASNDQFWPAVAYLGH